MRDPARPFSAIRVVEFGQYVAVPFCAQLLAEGGAEVVKVEALGGDPVRHLAPLAPGESRHFVSRNRGKRVLPLALTRPEARPVIDALVARADVVLTNLRPGLAAELGLDWAQLGPRHPRLVVGNVSAFGPRGPDAGLPGMDLVVQARSGLMATAGRVRDGLPAAGDSPFADYMCAMILAFGVAAALLRRERTGRGGEVDVALLMAALTLQNNAMLRVASVDGPRDAALRARLAALRAAGAPHEAQAACTPEVRVPAMTQVYYRTYAAKDGTLAVACVSRALQRAMMRAVGLADPANDGPPLDPAAQERHYAALRPRVEAVIASRAVADWQELFAAHGVPAAGFRFALELLDDEQALANGMLHDLSHPALGPVRVLASPLRLDGGGFRPAPATGPFGSETRAILAELGLEPAAVAALLAAGVTSEAWAAAGPARETADA
jgi:crotonobetainyl-CoA:carnitine CoA-transferase CaiB-like acyl-CoA transferase